MKATLTSKGQITIPARIRERLGLKPGTVLDFDESAPFLKATKVIPPGAWTAFRDAASDPWPGVSASELIDELRDGVTPA